MRINSIKNNVNFDGIYRIRNVENEREIIEKVLKPYSYVRHRDVILQHGENIYTPIYAANFESYCKSTGYAKYWVIQNAKNHGLDVIIPDMNTLTIYTDEGDFNYLKSYLHDENKKKNPDLMERLRRFFGKSEYLKERDKIISEANKVPDHLKPLSLITNIYTKLSQNFEEKFGAIIVDVDNPKDLLAAMINEK